MNMHLKIRHTLFFSVIFNLSGCKKLIEVPPPVTQLSSENVYTTDATAAAVLTGVYTLMGEDNPVPNNIEDVGYLYLLGGLSADELSLDGGNANSNKEL